MGIKNILKLRSGKKIMLETELDLQKFLFYLNNFDLYNAFELIGFQGQECIQREFSSVYIF